MILTYYLILEFVYLFLYC